MAKQTTTVDDLPTLDDFTESSLLDAVEEEKKPSDLEEEEEEDLEEEEEEIPENPLDKKIPEKKKKKDEKPKDLDDDPEEEEEEEEEDKDDDDDDNEETAESFWSDVEKITGVEVEVDYGDVDPETPEGAALREAALVEKTEGNIWKYIETNFPKSFKALTVEANGGDLSELITPNYVDYSKITVEEDNVAQQKKILLDYYMEVKKLPEKKAVRMVEADEDSEDDKGLFNAAKEAIEERKTDQIKHETEVAEKNEKEVKKREAEDQQMLGYIKAVTDKGDVGSFQLAKADKEKFFEFFAGRVNRSPEGGYMFSSPITNDNFNELLEQAYFSFKGGNVDKLVSRRQETKKTRTLKRNAKNDKTKASSSQGNKKDTKKLPTMDDFND